jgi:hypothetical protein
MLLLLTKGPAMSQLPKPLNNNVLVEILDKHSKVSRSTTGESQKKGRLVSFIFGLYHLTASAAIELDQQANDSMRVQFTDLIAKGANVYWEEFANEGQTFTHEGKSYAFVAWWRLTGYELPEETKA